MSDYWKQRIIDAFRDYCAKEAACRDNPHSWRSVHPPMDTPEGIEYERVSGEFQKAAQKLWEVTDVEYDEDGFREIVWKWRYHKVLARKGCWFVNRGQSKMAADEMRMLHEAEADLARVCGVIYQQPVSNP